MRALLLSATLAACAACAGTRTGSPPGSIGPAPAPRPTRPGPSSDQVWLVEMLTQRLELSAALAWSVFEGTDRDGELARARFLALVEQAARASLPPEPAAAFFGQQNRAAEAWQKLLFRRWADPRRRPAAPAPPGESIRSQMDAVDFQIIATLLRLGNFPQGKELRAFAIKRFKERGIPRTVATSAAASF